MPRKDSLQKKIYGLHRQLTNPFSSEYSVLSGADLQEKNESEIKN